MLPTFLLCESEKGKEVMDIFDRRYFVLNKALLRSTGLWPYEDRRKKLYIRTFVNLILGICVIFPQIVRIYNYFGVNMNMVLEHAAVLMYITSIYLKFLTSVYYEEKVLTLRLRKFLILMRFIVTHMSHIFTTQLRVVYDNIAKNWQVIKDENEVSILIQYSENGRLLTIGYTMYIIAAFCSYVFLPIVPVLLDVFNPLNQTRSRFYILGGEYFIIDNVKDYGKVYAFDCLAVIVTVWLISAVDSMYAASIEHCLGLFAIVKLRLQTCTRSICDGQKDESYKMIVRLIRMHKDIIKFSMEGILTFDDILESSYSSSFLILVGINVIFLSFECIIVLTRFGQAMEMMRYSMIMVGIVVHLFYISWPGQKLIDFSLGLFQDAYLNEWYTCPTRAQKLLGLMTLRCLKPCQLTAGGMYVMNFSNFAKIVKTSMSYMTYTDQLARMNRISSILYLIGIIYCQFNTVLGNPDSNRQPKIVNAYPAQTNQFPYLVSIYHTGKDHDCGGGIMADQYILTAAHLVDTVDSVHNTGNRIGVEKAYVLKSYQHPRHDKDIGILKLNESLQLFGNPQRRKLDLPKIGTDYTGEAAVIAGFGRTDPDDRSTMGEHLFYSAAKIVSNKDCEDDHKKSSFFVTENHICAKIMQSFAGVHTGVCNGDSGSPLVVDGNTVVGITSPSAANCDERRSPSRYTRVSSYLSFIKAVVTGQLNNKIAEYNVPPPPKDDPCASFLTIRNTYHLSHTVAALLDDEGIIGGEEASPNQFPYLVSVYRTNSRHNCMGGIINDRYILTAAHCIVNPSTGRFFNIPMEIVVNTLDLVNDTGIGINIKKDFAEAGDPNDIGILKLSESLDLSNNPQRQRLDLPKAGIDYVGRDGSGDSGSPLVIDNTAVGVTIVAEDNCDERLKPALYAQDSRYLPFIETVLSGQLNTLLLCLFSIMSSSLSNVLGMPDSGRRTKMIGGKEAKPNQLKYLVSIYHTNPQHNCGGGTTYAASTVS
ncbi:hypothetical protein TSAR_000941 [Trichomalopsis sarcophagae]|uniref:Peptidase S1 domain-containing protein n=1 Tax=Trichomalopsis sarcophagae TaxID=543379 RepID=A0A232F2A4_9HYME|nr:hypothetical protein TSAR_000941 [Trichomalopsis sarcophagae]